MKNYLKLIFLLYLVVFIRGTDLAAAEVELSQNSIDFGTVSQGTSITKNVDIIAPESVKISAIESESTYVIGRILPELEEGKYSISIVLSSLAPVGLLNEQLIIKTTSPNDPVCALTVSAEVVCDISIKPEKILFSLADGGAALLSSFRTVHVSSVSGKLFTIKNADSMPNIFSIETIPHNVSSSYMVMISALSLSKPELMSGEIHLSIDSREQPVVIIPFQIVQ